MHISKKLILASRSPRRQLLLKQIGLSFEIRESGVDEGTADAMTPEQCVRFLSKKKAEAVARDENDAIVIGADTIVVLDGDMLGKPQDASDAARMLKRLSGRTHQVYTGFTLYDCSSGDTRSEVEVTSVTFRRLGEEEIDAYVLSGSPLDKAGAYGIQDDYGAVFVERIEGCFYNVVGFPLAKFYTTFLEFQQQLSVR